MTVSLEEEADKLAEQAEGKAGTLMARLITKSNLLRRKCKENSGVIQKNGGGSWGEGLRTPTYALDFQTFSQLVELSSLDRKVMGLIPGTVN